MADKDFIINVTASDFDVELIAGTDRYYLYGALRPGGKQRIATSQGPWVSHVCGVWHFVLLEILGPTMTRVEQMHIPRFVMADGLDSLLRIGRNPKGHLLHRPPLILMKEDRVGFVGFGNWTPRTAPALDRNFVEKLRAELPVLEEARETVRGSGDMYYLPRVKTAAGYPVESASEKLVHAVAFERLCVKRLTAGNFGIYSAFCTYRDFETSNRMPRKLIRELVAGQLQYDPNEISEEILELFGKVQNTLLSEPIWGKGVKVSKEKAVDILGEGMARLTRTQRVQFILMNGMHAAGTFLPLAVITGDCDFERYASYLCQGFQPDSPEEQERRTEIAYIRLYGEIADTPKTQSA